MRPGGGGAGGGPSPMETETAKTSTKRRNKDVSDTEVTSCKQKMTYIRSRRGLFKDHNPIYEDLTKKEYPVLLQSASNELTHKVPMDILKVNGILKEILGVQYVKAAGNFYVKVYFGCAKDANAFLLNKPVLQENNWKATIPYDSIECQGIIRAPVDLSEETLLEDLKASCMILGVKRFTKKQDDGQFKPLPTVLVTFMASSRPDLCFSASDLINLDMAVELVKALKYVPFVRRVIFTKNVPHHQSSSAQTVVDPIRQFLIPVK
ncbi:uncharacterized protein LOC133523109 [Cydia pomonella]|uniref:uncharacterized protein LOC133523109 n=1 Tax=Cydia pomonella TaxID=82600 RepID=UPI002ADDE078|nr:uncharacterized protein LOC133523109 [Cydia pomonella]